MNSLCNPVTLKEKADQPTHALDLFERVRKRAQDQVMVAGLFSTLAIGTICCGALPGCATEGRASGRPHELARVQIDNMGQHIDVAHLYPERAQKERLAKGSATLVCRVTDQLTLEKCVVVSEAPANYGFGEAALRISKNVTLKPKTSDGVSVVGGLFRTQINLKLAP